MTALTDAESITRIATTLGHDTETTHQVRLCDCADNRHEYAPTTSDWAWMTAAEVEAVAVYHPECHRRFRTTVVVRIGGES